MPVHKPFEADILVDAEATDPHHHLKQSRPERESEEQAGEEQLLRGEEEAEEDAEELHPKLEDEGEEEASDSEGSPSLSAKEKPEFVFVYLPEIRKDVQCPICLGIIRKTRTVMECLHRFCRECIDKSMRMGNNECPACRTHCASRRSLRDDPNYDALIAALYPDIDKYEEEELALHEDERNRNKQIQESIALIFQKQSEALAKKRLLGKDSATGMITRSRRNHKNSNLKRRNSRGAELQDPDEVEEENDDEGGKDSSSADERFTEAPPRRKKRRLGFRSSQPSSSSANGDSGYLENELDASRDNRGMSPGLVWNSEILAWGRGGARSHTRHGSGGGVSSKISRSTRLTKLVDYLGGLEENTDEVLQKQAIGLEMSILVNISCLQLDIHLMLISLDKENISSLQQPYLCCSPSLSVRKLCRYIACKTHLGSELVEVMVIKRNYSSHDGDQWMNSPSISISKDGLNGDELEVLEEQETLAGLKSCCNFTGDYLILGYRRKQRR